MGNLTPAQAAMLKNLILIGMLFMSMKIASTAIRYSIFAAVAFVIYHANQNGTLSGGWTMKVDPGMAVDILFPKMNPGNKTFARMAADTVLGALLSPRSVIQTGVI